MAGSSGPLGFPQQHVEESRKTAEIRENKAGARILRPDGDCFSLHGKEGSTVRVSQRALRPKKYLQIGILNGTSGPLLAWEARSTLCLRPRARRAAGNKLFGIGCPGGVESWGTGLGDAITLDPSAANASVANNRDSELAMRCRTGQLVNRAPLSMSPVVGVRTENVAACSWHRAERGSGRTGHEPSCFVRRRSTQVDTGYSLSSIG